MSFYENLKFTMIKNFEEYKSHYNESIENPEKYWKEYASSFNWIKKPNEVLSWNFDDPKVEWFKDGELNITENIFERNSSRKDDTAIIWEPNNPKENTKSFTFDELFKKVCSFANI